MSGEYREVPSDLITHNPKEHNAPIEATASGEVPLENMDHTPGTSTGAPSPSIYTPNKTGLTAAAIATPAAITGQKVVGAGNWIMDRFGKPSLQTYANSQIGDKNLNIPVKDLQKLTGLPVPVTNPALVQRASKIISGREATPDTFKEIYTVDPVTGKQTLSHIEKTPGISAIDPLDPSKLKPYEKNAKYYVKKHGELPLRTGVAAYDIGKGLSEENKLVGGAEVGAGVAMGAAPWLPKSVKGIPVRGIATGLGLLPGASEAIGSANAEPLDIPGMAIDYGMGLMAPSTLGEATIHPKNKAYQPGMTGILHGTTLPPEHHAAGGVIHLAEGGQPELGTAQAYEPSYSEKIRDYAAKHIGREHANRLFGGANARVEDNFNPIAMALQTPGAIADAATGFVKSGQEGDYLGGMGNYLMGAMNVAPMIKPGAQVAKTAMRELGPKAADMAENYLARIGGVQYAVPADTKIMRASEALSPHEGKWLNTTQSDRMRSTGGDLGGPGFSRFQQTDPAYKDAAWGVGKPGTATGIVNINKKYPEGQAIWSPMIGAETQHHSNQHVHDALVDEFNRQAGLGKLTPELRAEMNARLTQYPEYANLFKKGIDVGNPESLKQMGDTFDRRAAISTVLGGKGVGGTKGQIFDYPGIMQQMTDPMTIGSPTHSVGTRLFSLNNQIEHRPDLHSAFPYILKGQDQGVAFNPVPKELAIPDWMNLVREFKGREPGYMDYTRGLKGKGTPNQFISENYLRSLESAGHATGGKVGAAKKLFEEAQAAYKAKFTPGFYHGSPSNNIKAFDPKYAPSEAGVSTDAAGNKLAEATFLTSDPSFANSFLPAGKALGYKPGSTVYPVSANLGKHFDYETPEGHKVIKDYLAKVHPVPADQSQLAQWMRDRAVTQGNLKEGAWSAIEDPAFQDHLLRTGHNSFALQEAGRKNIGIFDPKNIRGKFAEFNPEHAADPDFMKATGGPVQHFQVGGLAKLASKFARHPHGQDARVAQALEEYLKGNISQEERIRIMNQFLPMRQWDQLPPNYTDDQIRNALLSNKQPKALAPVPAGMRVGNRLDIPAYTQNGVYVDTTHALSGNKSPISYNRTGHLTDVDFSSKPDKAVRVGLGTQPQALTPMASEYGADKSPFALIRGTNVGTSDDEVRRMMTEMMQDPNYTQIGMDPRKHSQFYDKSTGMPVWSAEEKLQSGPLIIAPKKGLETTSWDDPRLNLTDFPGKQYAVGGSIQGYADGKSVMSDIYKNIVPAQIRTFGETVMGDKSPITEQNFNPDELDKIRKAIMQSRGRQEFDKNNRLLPISPTNYNQSVGYKDYGVKDSSNSRQDFNFGPDAAIRNTLGKFSYDKTPEGNLIAKDTYDFKDDLVKEEGVRRSSEYANMGPLQKIGTLISDTVSPKGSINTLPSRIGSAFVGANGRPVEINLGKSPFKKGGKVKK